MFFVRLYILPYSTLSIAHLDSTRLDLTLHHYLCSTVRTMLLAPSHHHKRKLFLEFSLLVLSSPAVYPHPAHALHTPKPNLIAPPRTYLCVVFSYLACVVFFFFSTSATDRYNHTLPACSRRFPFHSLLHTCYLWHSVIFFFSPEHKFHYLTDMRRLFAPPHLHHHYTLSTAKHHTSPSSFPRYSGYRVSAAL